MNASTRGWTTLWERRLLHRLDDRFAAILSSHLHLRIRSFESVTERVLGLRTEALGDKLAFLSLEVDERDTPLVRVTGPQGREGALLGIVQTLEEAIDSAERARYPRPRSVGLPFWVPFPPGETIVTRLLFRRRPRHRWLKVTWPAGFPVPQGEGSERPLACLGIIVDSLRATLEVAIEAGGELVPTQSSPEFALLADPGGHPLLLWEKPRSTPIRDVLAARVDFVTGGIDHLAAFYHRVAGWETQVLPQDGSTVAVLTHHDRAVGILREGPEEQTVAHLIGHPREAVWPAQFARDLEVDNLKIWPLLGRQWRIRDWDDNALVVAENAPAARPAIQLTPLTRLPAPLSTAFQDLDTALGMLDMVQRQLTERPGLVRTPPPGMRARALLIVLHDVLIPAAEACKKANENHRTLGPDHEALTYMRQTVTNVLSPCALTVERLDDMDLSRVFRFACRLLVRAQLLPENIDERLGGHVSV